MDCVLTQPDASVPVTVYVVVVEGVAIVIDPLVTVRSVAGDHVYVLAPDAVSVELVPLQKSVAVADMLITGSARTVAVTATLEADSQPVVFALAAT
jgi:hypothetical protein